MLPYQLLFSCSSKHRHPSKVTNKPIGSSSSLTPPSGNSKPSSSCSSKRPSSASKTSNSSSGPPPKLYKPTTTNSTNLQKCLLKYFILAPKNKKTSPAHQKTSKPHVITYKKPDKSSNNNQTQTKICLSPNMENSILLRILAKHTKLPQNPGQTSFSSSDSPTPPSRKFADIFGASSESFATT